MKPLPEFSAAYFQKFSEMPVPIKPFNPQSKLFAEKYIYQLKKLLTPQFGEVQIQHRGSTFLGIAGKGEIEIGIYPSEAQWNELVTYLTNKYGDIGNQEENYARFNDVFEGFNMEIVMMKGYEAQVDIRVTDYLSTHPKLLKEYEQIKKKFSYSKREYQIRKDQFFRKVISEIPEQ